MKGFISHIVALSLVAGLMACNENRGTAKVTAANVGQNSNDPVNSGNATGTPPTRVDPAEINPGVEPPVGTDPIESPGVNPIEDPGTEPAEGPGIDPTLKIPGNGPEDLPAYGPRDPVNSLENYENFASDYFSPGNNAMAFHLQGLLYDLVAIYPVGDPEHYPDIDKAIILNLNAATILLNYMVMAAEAIARQDMGAFAYIESIFPSETAVWTPCSAFALGANLPTAASCYLPRVVASVATNQGVVLQWRDSLQNIYEQVLKPVLDNLPPPGLVDSLFHWPLTAVLGEIARAVTQELDRLAISVHAILKMVQVFEPSVTNEMKATRFVIEAHLTNLWWSVVADAGSQAHSLEIKEIYRAKLEKAFKGRDSITCGELLGVATPEGALCQVRSLLDADNNLQPSLLNDSITAIKDALLVAIAAGI